MVGRRRTWIVVAGVSYLLGFGFLGTHRASGQDKLPNGEEVFAKGVKSLGDPEKLKRIQSVLLQQDVEIKNENGKSTIETLQCVDGRGYHNINLSGKIFVGKFDGTVLKSGPKGEEQTLTGPQQFMGRLELVPSIAQSYRLFFDKVTNLGKAKFEGVDCYEIECEREEQANMDCYFSIETGLMVGYTIEIPEVLGNPLSIVKVLYDDYQPIEEVLFPHKKTYHYPGSNQIVRVTSCKVNPPIDEKVFKP